MRQLVVDTDVVSYVFKWHPSAPSYLEALKGNDPVISFMTLAEVRFGALQAVLGTPQARSVGAVSGRFCRLLP